MTTRAVAHAHSLTKVGAPARMAWIVLVAIAVLGFVNHAVGSVTIAEKDPEPLMFALFAGLNAYQAVVLMVPYRRLERPLIIGQDDGVGVCRDARLLPRASLRSGRRRVAAVDRAPVGCGRRARLNIVCTSVPGSAS